MEPARGNNKWNTSKDSCSLWILSSFCRTQNRSYLHHMTGLIPLSPQPLLVPLFILMGVQWLILTARHIWKTLVSSRSYQSSGEQCSKSFLIPLKLSYWITRISNTLGSKIHYKHQHHHPTVVLNTAPVFWRSWRIYYFRPESGKIPSMQIE